MKSRLKYQGFTVIEIIAVIVLLGIISAVVVPRFLGPNVFNERAAHDALITSIRTAQQAALGRKNVSFEINRVGETWTFSVKEGISEIIALDISARNVKLETGTADALLTPTDSCASGTRFNTPVSAFVLKFDKRGNLSEFENTTVGTEEIDSDFNGVRICVNDTVSSSVCVSRAGYAYSGDCDV